MSELEFRLPDVGEGLSEGEIVRWRVAPGDEVRRDETVVEIETDKSLVELPAPRDGKILRLGGEEGDILPVGSVLLVMEVETGAVEPSDTDTSPAAASPAEDAAPTEAPRPAAPNAVPADTAGGPRRVRAAPAVRKFALQRGVELAQVEGTGPGGRITKEDVEAATGVSDEPAAPDAPSGPVVTPRAARAQGQTAEDEVVPLRGLRRQIAKTMTQAWQQVPHITDIREVDATRLVEARHRLLEYLEPQGVRFSYLPLLIRAVTTTLATNPKFNASVNLDDETITYHGRRNIGLATATDDGLIVPVLHDADQLDLTEIARQVDVLAAAARERTLTVEQTAKGTCTITNFGTFGGWIATPIIRPPEAAIVGFGRIRDQVVAVDGQPVVRPTLPVSVSADHRLIDGDDMGRFLNRLTELLTDPVRLLAGDR